MTKSTPVDILSAALGLALVQLDSRRLRYTTRLLNLPDYHPAAQLLLETLRYGDAYAQRNEQPLE